MSIEKCDLIFSPISPRVTLRANLFDFPVVPTPMVLEIIHDSDIIPDITLTAFCARARTERTDRTDTLVQCAHLVLAAVSYYRMYVKLQMVRGRVRY